MLRKIIAQFLLAAPLALAQESPDKPVVRRIQVEDVQAGPHDVLINAPLLMARTAVAAEKVTYLGVVTSPVPAAMAEQLKLARGVGLVVDRVEPQTAAESAGIKPHDLIEKLDDQLIVNSEQLARLVKNHKEGDEVTLSILRQGQRQPVKVKLALGVPPTEQFINLNLAIPPNAGDHVIKLPGGAGGRVMIRNYDGRQSTEWSDQANKIFIAKQGDRISRVTIQDHAGKGLVTVEGDADAVRKALAKTPELLEKFNQAEQAAQVQPVRIAFEPHMIANTALPAMAARGKVMTWSDEQYILVLRMMGKQPTYLLALSKKDGRTMFDGPVMSEEQRKSVPGEVSEQFQLVVSQPHLLKEFGVEKK